MARKRQSRIVTGPVGSAMAPEEQDAPVESLAPVVPVKPKATFYGGGTIGPIIDGKRYTIRFLPENGYVFKTDIECLAQWLRDNGYREKV
jgi:hypothetical protein